MSTFKYLVYAFLIFLLVGTTSVKAAPQGFMEGHLKIISRKGVELADETPSKMTAENYADYPTGDSEPGRKEEAAQVTADGNGNYRASLPPGDYLLDLQDRVRKHVRAKPQPFTVVSNQTVHVDMDIDTRIRLMWIIATC
jgi:hypothetical protein